MPQHHPRAKSFKNCLQALTLSLINEISLRVNFPLSPDKSIIFFAIGTKGLGDMKGTKFKAKKKEKP